MIKAILLKDDNCEWLDNPDIISIPLTDIQNHGNTAPRYTVCFGEPDDLDIVVLAGNVITDENEKFYVLSQCHPFGYDNQINMEKVQQHFIKGREIDCSDPVTAMLLLETYDKKFRVFFNDAFIAVAQYIQQKDDEGKNANAGYLEVQRWFKHFIPDRYYEFLSGIFGDDGVFEYYFKSKQEKFLFQYVDELVSNGESRATHLQDLLIDMLIHFEYKHPIINKVRPVVFASVTREVAKWILANLDNPDDFTVKFIDNVLDNESYDGGHYSNIDVLYHKNPKIFFKYASDIIKFWIDEVGHPDQWLYDLMRETKNDKLYVWLDYSLRGNKPVMFPLRMFRELYIHEDIDAYILLMKQYECMVLIEYVFNRELDSINPRVDKLAEIINIAFHADMELAVTLAYTMIDSGNSDLESMGKQIIAIGASNYA